MAPRRDIATRGAVWVGSVALAAGAAWLAVHVGLVLLTYVGVVLDGDLPRTGVPGNPHAFVVATVSPAQLLRAWAQWDAGWYLSISRNGYDSAQSTAFFPLFPMLTGALAAAVGPAGGVADARADTFRILAGLIVANLSSLAAFVAVALLAFHETGKRTVSLATVWLVAAYPFAFLLAAPFTEATFLACAALALLFARRGRWPLAALFAFLAGLSRTTGLILVLPLAWEFARQRGWTSARWWRQRRPPAMAEVLGFLGVGAAVPLAFLAYIAYLAARFHDPLAFVHAQAAWSRGLTPPWTTVNLIGSHLAAQPAWGYWQLLILLDLGLFIGFALVTVLAARRLPISLTLFSAGLLALSFASPARDYVDVLTGTDRFLTGAVPVFLVLAIWSDTRPNFQLGLLSTGFLLQAALAVFYLSGGWLF